METLRVGIIGAGSVAREFHLPAYADHPRAHTVALAELDSERRRRTAREFGISRTYADAETMLDEMELDAVSICTPPNTHESLFSLAAARGCHVFCEKPLAVDAESAASMRDIAEENGIVTQVGYLHRYYANYQKALKIRRNGFLGEIHEVRTDYHSAPPAQPWYSDPTVSGGGVVRDVLPHVLDFYLELFDVSLTIEDCSMRRLRTEAVEDIGRVRCRFGDTEASVSLGWTQPDFLSRTLIVGSSGWVEFGPVAMEGQIHGERIEFERGQTPVLDLGISEVYPAVDDDAYGARIREFVQRAIEGDRESTASFERGARIAAVVDEIYDREERA